MKELDTYFNEAKLLPAVEKVEEFDIPKPEQVRTISDLILLALGDLETLSQAKWFRFNIGQWVCRDFDHVDRCTACVAGAAMLRHITARDFEQFDSVGDNLPEIGSFSLGIAVNILNAIAFGSYKSASEYADLRYNSPLITDDYSMVGPDIVNVRADLLDAVRIFRSVESQEGTNV